MSLQTCFTFFSQKMLMNYFHFMEKEQLEHFSKLILLCSIQEKKKIGLEQQENKSDKIVVFRWNISLNHLKSSYI